MDARERLRLYLEQRRDMGESEFVLDALPVEDVLRLLGDKLPVAPRDGRAAPAQRSGQDSPAEPAAPAVRERSGPPASNWREALTSIGAGAPAAGGKAAPQAPAKAAAQAPPVAAPLDRGEAQADSAATDPRALPPTGIVVGGPRREVITGPLASLDSLDAIAAHAAACTACALSKTAKNAVPGEGNANAGFVCVGEAPGQTEDELGRPFVGRAGDLLTKILEAIALTREDVFICNVLKHRPPGNRNPAPDEIKACSPYLMRQLELLQPRVILALGTFASQTLLQTTQPIGKLRGAVHRFHGIPLICTYHPAALLRNPAWKRPTWDDVQLARRIFDSAAQG